MGYSDRKKFWFGPIGGMRWIPTPASGAEVSPTGWGGGGTFLSGGGFQTQSMGSHREFTFEWGPSSSYEAAQEMAEFAAGSYGEGLMYFIPPTIYDKNVLPPQWASPGTLQGPTTLIRGVTPSVQNEQGPPTLRYAGNYSIPSRHAVYSSALIPTDGRQEGDGVFIPVPYGYDLLVGFVGSAPTGRGVFVDRVNYNGVTGSTTRVRPVDTALDGALQTVTTLFPGSATDPLAEGYRVWVGQSGAAQAGNIVLAALTARLVPSGSITQADLDQPFADLPAIAKKTWTGGMGHSGCRFTSKPTMILNTGIDGGTASYAATLREVGTWLR